MTLVSIFLGSLELEHTADTRTANAVARVENLEFLTDVVPKTQTYKQVKQKQTKEPAARANGVANGQRTLDQHMGEASEGQATNGAAHESEDMDIDNAAPAGSAKLGSDSA